MWVFFCLKVDVLISDIRSNAHRERFKQLTSLESGAEFYQPKNWRV